MQTLKNRAPAPDVAASARDYPSDRALVKAVQRGDRSAFDLLVLKYQHRVVKLIARFVADPSDALDVAQETFVRAYRAMPSFRGESTFFTWLYRIAVNTAKNHIVAAARRAPYSGGLDLQDAERCGVISKLKNLDSPEALALSEEILQAINAAIRDLPDELRTALLLRETEGMSYLQIAETMECPVGTVRSRIFRARQAIEQKIEPLLG